MSQIIELKNIVIQPFLENIIYISMETKTRIKEFKSRKTDYGYTITKETFRDMKKWESSTGTYIKKAAFSDIQQKTRCTSQMAAGCKTSWISAQTCQTSA